jgi:hypothetical protein
MERSIVSMRVGFVLRSAEIKLSFFRFVRQDTSPPSSLFGAPPPPLLIFLDFSWFLYTTLPTVVLSGAMFWFFRSAALNCWLSGARSQVPCFVVVPCFDFYWLFRVPCFDFYTPPPNFWFFRSSHVLIFIDFSERALFWLFYSSPNCWFVRSQVPCFDFYTPPPNFWFLSGRPMFWFLLIFQSFHVLIFMQLPPTSDFQVPGPMFWFLYTTPNFWFFRSSHVIFIDFSELPCFDFYAAPPN